MKLFRSYLTDRLQCTTFNASLSEKLPVKTGVPQGSIFLAARADMTLKMMAHKKASTIKIKIKYS